MAGLRSVYERGRRGCRRESGSIRKNESPPTGDWPTVRFAAQNVGSAIRMRYSGVRMRKPP
jgi:hypothetical protein